MRQRVWPCALENHQEVIRRHPLWEEGPTLLITAFAVLRNCSKSFACIDSLNEPPRVGILSLSLCRGGN